MRFPSYFLSTGVSQGLVNNLAYYIRDLLAAPCSQDPFNMGSPSVCIRDQFKKSAAFATVVCAGVDNTTEPQLFSVMKEVLPRDALNQSLVTLCFLVVLCQNTKTQQSYASPEDSDATER